MTFETVTVAPLAIACFLMVGLLKTWRTWPDIYEVRLRIAIRMIARGEASIQAVQDARIRDTARRSRVSDLERTYGLLTAGPISDRARLGPNL